MSVIKIRAKSAAILQQKFQNEGNHKNNTFPVPKEVSSALLKIESFVPVCKTRFRKHANRSYTTLKTNYIKRVIDPKYKFEYHRQKCGRYGSILSSKRSKRHLYPNDCGTLQPTSKFSTNSFSVSYLNNSSESNKRKLDEGDTDFSYGSVITNNDGICKIIRPKIEQEKLPDRINCDRRGLTTIPYFENEKNLRLLSLQHNLINVFHIPETSISNFTNEVNSPNADLKHNVEYASIKKIDSYARICSLQTLSEKTNQGKESSLITPIIKRKRIQKLSRKGIVSVNKKVNETLENTAPITSSKNIPPILPMRNSSPLSTNSTYATSVAITSLRTSSSLINGNHNSSSLGPRQILKTSFIQKSIIFHANERFNTLKRSKSFLYSKNFNNFKRKFHQKFEDVSSFNTSFDEKNLIEKEKNKTEVECNDVKNSEVVKSKENKKNNFVYGTSFHNLIFLDLYDNQIEKILNLDGFKSLTVLLLGKNRISDLTGLSSLKNSLRVLDLHGNKITSITNKINCLQELKSLNLAGNQIRQINQFDFDGLINLKELNLKRNKIKRVFGFDHLSSLERLWLCHNDLHKIEDISSIAKAINLQEVTIENNPVSLAGDCVSFLVSYLPNLKVLSQIPISDHVRRSAVAWRKNKELSDSNFSYLASDIFNSIRREEVISNARTNWELLRLQQNIIAPKANNSNNINPFNQKCSTKICENVSTDLESVTEYESKNSLHANLAKIPIISNNLTLLKNNSREAHQQHLHLPSISPTYFSTKYTQSSKVYINSTPKRCDSPSSSLGPNVDSSSSCVNSDTEENIKHNVNADCKNNIFFNVNKNLLQTSQIQELEEMLIDISEELNIKNRDNLEVNVIQNFNIDGLDNVCIEATNDSLVYKNEIITANNISSAGTDSNSQSDKNSNISATALNSESSVTSIAVNHSSGSCESIISTNNVEKVQAKQNCLMFAHTAVNSKRYSQGTLTKFQTIRPSKENLYNTFCCTNSSNCLKTYNNNIWNCEHFCNAGSAIKMNINNSNLNGPPTNTLVNRALIDREREQGGDYLIEICGRYLNIYGMGALRYIDKQWSIIKATDVHTLNFSYINFNNTSLILSRIKVRFPNAENFFFRETNIHCLGQLNALADLQGISSLNIDSEGNPMIWKKSWRLYTIYRLHHWGLKTINSVEITQDEVCRAQIEYSGLSDLILWSLPDIMLQPLLHRLRLDETCSASKLIAKEWLMKAEQSLKLVVGKEALQWKKIVNTAANQEEYSARERGKTHFSVVMENTCNAVEKLQLLEKFWPTMMVEIIRNTILDYSQIDVYLKSVSLDVIK